MRTIKDIFKSISRLTIGLLLSLGVAFIGTLAYGATVYPAGSLLQPNDVTSSHIRDNTIVNADINSSAAFTFASTTTYKLGAGTIYATSTLSVGATTTFNGVGYSWPNAAGTTNQVLQTNGSQTLAWATIASSKFGGDGTDGALSLTTGTTTIDVGGVDVFTKNYTSISITGTGALAFTNPNAGGTTIILKSQGACTLTSSAVPNISTINMGAAAATVSGGIQDTTTHTGGTGGTPTAGTAGTIIAANTIKWYYTNSSSKLSRYEMYLVPGSGGANGGAGQGTGATAGGAGGRGGGALKLECGTAWNFTGTIKVSGGDGVAAANGSGASAGGGGAGGSTGHLLALYNTLTANSGTVTAAGGTGGAGGSSTNSGNGWGGGGGGGSAGHITAGVAGGAGGSTLNDATANGTAGTAGNAGVGGGGGGGAGSNGAHSAGAGGTAGASDSNSYLIVQNSWF